MVQLIFYGIAIEYDGSELGLYKLPQNRPAGFGSLIPEYTKLDPSKLAQLVKDKSYPKDEFIQSLEGIVKEAGEQARGFFPGVSCKIVTTDSQIKFDDALPLEAIPNFLLADFDEKRQCLINSINFASQLLKALYL